MGLYGPFFLVRIAAVAEAAAMIRFAREQAARSPAVSRHDFLKNLAPDPIVDRCQRQRPAGLADPLHHSRLRGRPAATFRDLLLVSRSLSSGFPIHPCHQLAAWTCENRAWHERSKSG